MSPRQNLTGQRFGRLVATSYAFTAKDGRGFWNCVCDCGNKKLTAARALKVGDTVSCGCRRSETSWRKHVAKTGRANKQHGHAREIRTPEYHSWTAMRTRCNNPLATAYERYGGAGIKVCKRWNSFKNFLADMGKRPAGTTLDRINSNGNYTPSNCRWATPLEQNRNRRK
jgi:hypothetical protein